jgi:hypothetical protein
LRKFRFDITKIQERLQRLKLTTDAHALAAQSQQGLI